MKKLHGQKESRKKSVPESAKRNTESEISRNDLHDTEEENDCIVFKEEEDDPKTCKTLGHQDAHGPCIPGEKRRKGIIVEVSINGGEAEEMAHHDVWHDFLEAVQLYRKSQTLRKNHWKFPMEDAMKHWVRVIKIVGMALEEIKSKSTIDHKKLTHGVVADNVFFKPDVV